MHDLKYFRLLSAGLDVAPALHELAAQRALWEFITARQDYQGGAHADTQMIMLRGPTTADNIFDNLESVDHAALQDLPLTGALIGESLQPFGVRDYGRIMAVRLRGTGKILPHTDQGVYAKYFARVHIAISSPPECRFYCGDEDVHMAPGEMWWFNHQVEHRVENGPTSRIHLIVDIAAPGFTGAIG